MKIREWLGNVTILFTPLILFLVVLQWHNADVDLNPYIGSAQSCRSEIEHITASSYDRWVSGQWMEYQLCFPSGGNYLGVFDVSLAGRLGVFHLEIDGHDVTGPLVAPSTFVSGSYLPLRVRLSVSDGAHAVRIVFDEGNFTIRSFGFHAEGALVNVRDFGAVGDGLADDSQAVLNAQEEALRRSTGLYFPNGTYRLLSKSHPILVRQFPVKTSWIGEDKNQTIIKYESTGIHSRGLAVYPEDPAPMGAEYLGISATTPRARIVEQSSGLSSVRVENIQDINSFATGDAVFIASGKNPYDADDPSLFQYMEIFEIQGIDASSANITLDRKIPIALRVAAPFNGTAGSAKEYVVGNHYESGDIVFYNASFYRAVTSGIAATSNPMSDGRVAEIRILNPGSGYVNPQMRLMGGDGTGASGKAVSVHGTLTQAQVLQQGSGYTRPPSVSIQDSRGSGGRAEVVLSGIVWRQITTSIGAMTKESQDYRPFVQKIVAPRLGVYVKNFTILLAGYPHISAFQFRGAKDGVLEDVVVKGAAVMGAGAVNSSNIRFNRILIDLLPYREANNGYRALGSWSNDSFVVSNSDLKGGRNENGAFFPAIYIEGGSALTLYSTKIKQMDPLDITKQTVGLYLDYGSASVHRSRFEDFTDPIRWNVSLKNIKTDVPAKIYEIGEIRNNYFRTSSKATRLFGNNNQSVWGPTNRYEFVDLYSGAAYPEQVNFVPEKVVRLSYTFRPDEFQQDSGLIRLDQYQTVDGASVDTHQYAFAVLGVSGQWNGTAESGVDVRVGATREGVTRGLLGHIFDSQNALLLNGNVQQAENFDGLGNSYRYIEPKQEAFTIQYYSGELLSAENGDITITIEALMAPLAFQGDITPPLPPEGVSIVEANSS